MNSAPRHARRRRYRLLVLIVALFAVSALSPRLRPDFQTPKDEVVVPFARQPAIAMRLPDSAASLTDVSQALAEADAEDLFAYLADPVDAAAIEQRAPVPSKNIRYVVLNPVLLQGKHNVFWEPQGRLQVPLPDGSRIDVEITHTETLGPDRFTSRGRVLGDPRGRAVFAYFDGRLAARIETKDGDAYELRPVADESGDVDNQFYEIDPSLIPDCGGPDAVQPEAALMRRLAESTTDNGGAQADGAASSSLGPTVDILMVYTSAVRAALGSTSLVQLQLDLGIARVNSDLELSAISARVKLAGSMEVTYAGDEVASSSPGWQATALSRLRGETDGFMDEVHARRTAVGADLVCLLVQRPDSESSGIAYILTEPRDYAGPYFAFSVVGASSVASSVLSHELGHNLGAAHARGDPGATGTDGGAYSYSYGYRFSTSDSAGRVREVRTIMAYSPGTRLGYFSNPRLSLPVADIAGAAVSSPASPALGIADGLPGAADNARTIDENAFQVANFRQAAVGSDKGRLINVSTRAYVGPAEQQMIGGFVLKGTGSRTVLIRAIGPALGLAPINLPGVLADPTLEIIDLNRGTAIAANDNWGTPAGGAVTMANAARAAGAFALPNGSSDAALQLTLPPGAYGAVVGGKGSTGIALIEAYAVDAGTNRPVNLSTRAYGSVTKPIVAGFVIREDPDAPGQAKRVLIRALGPSLIGYGLTAGQVMGDPILRLYGTKGELLLENDDWDPPSTTFGQNIRSTARGTVDLYSEKVFYQAMSQLGAGSMLPIESGVVVDLLPGSYTINVVPFEQLPDQVAEPGVALVEVYELAQK